MKSEYVALFLLLMSAGVHANTVQAANYQEHPLAIDFLDIAGNSHATMILGPQKDDKRDVGGWCIEEVKIVLVKPNRGYGGQMVVATPQTCENVSVSIRKEKEDICIYLKEAVAQKSTEEPSSDRHCFVLADLLKVTSQSSIIANGTNAQIFLFNAPSLGSGATDGVPVNSGATIPFYLNASSAGEELVIKGNGAGIVSFGNDYAAHKTRWIGSTNISKFQLLDGNGAETDKKLDAKAHLVIDPRERVDITTPSGDWEIRLKVAEPIG